MAKSSWRFIFVDINKSITITEQDTKWISYISIRAPKGKTEADFIAPDNADLIKAMFGYPSADYPDLYDAIELNKSYGTYISAPAGTSAKVPNYYGGVYLTSLGVLHMYCNTSVTKPNFDVSIRPGEVTQKLHIAAAEKITATLNQPGKQAVITVTGVPAKVIKTTNEIVFDYWNAKVPFRYRLDKASGLIYPATSSVTNSEATLIACGVFKLQSDGTYTFQLGGDSSLNVGGSVQAQWNTAKDEITDGIPFYDFSKRGVGVYDYSAYYDSENDADGAKFAEWVDGTDAKVIADAILNGGKATIQNGTIDLVYDEPLFKKFRFMFNCKPYAKSWHVQKSPTAADTTMTLSNVVYDKYVYDQAIPYVCGGVAQLDKVALKDIVLYDNLVAVFGGSPTDPGIYQLQDVENDEGDVIGTEWVKVTGDFVTQKVLALKSLTSATDDEVEDNKNTKAAKETLHSIFYVDEDAAGNCTLVEMTEKNSNDNYVLVENPNFNTYEWNSTEVDEEDEIHSSGTYKGSLDESAVNPNGSDLFWEDVFPADAATYAEVHCINTFDEDLDEKGYYTGYRISEVSEIVNGQRYLDAIIEENIKNGNTGSNVTDATVSVQKQFAKIAKEALIEAAKPKYEEVRVFVETTGLESAKNYFSAIRTNHKMATTISPKNINEDIFNKISKMTVEGRCRGSAQFCQELQFKGRDKNGKVRKYWASPIGAVGAMLMRIIELAMGGVAPMWENDGGMGGQLDEFFIGRYPIKARWDFEDGDTKIMDAKGINPIVFDAEDGVMIISHKTTELDAGDWSYLGHSMGFDECKREIRDNVMKPQLAKKINDYWMDKRQEQVDKILNKRKSGSDPMWATAECDIKGVNTEYTKAQRKFMISVKVKVFPFSEYVQLNFTNESQISTTSE